MSDHACSSKQPSPYRHAAYGQTGRRRNSILHDLRHGPREGRKACVLHRPPGQRRIFKNSPVSAYRHSPESAPANAGELRHRSAERQRFPHGTRPLRRYRAPSPSSGISKESHLIPGISLRFQENRARMPEYCIYAPQRGPRYTKNMKNVNHRNAAHDA